MADSCSFVGDPAQCRAFNWTGARLAPSELVPIVSMPVCDPMPDGLGDRERSLFPELAYCFPAHGLIGMFLFTG